MAQNATIDCSAPAQAAAPPARNPSAWPGSATPKSARADSVAGRSASQAGMETVTAARAEALFVSGLSAVGNPTKAEVSAAIRDAIRRHGGTRGCAGEMAAAYGDRPEMAAVRMRWALQVVGAHFTPRTRSPVSPTTSSVGRGAVGGHTEAGGTDR
jgi:hypothetical protein